MSSEIKEINAEATEEKHVIVGTGDYETRISDEELAKKKRRKEIWDKITTGILILLMASPVLILAYIFLWFIFR